MGAVRKTKRCPRCTETKPLNDFLRPRSGTPDDYCHPCRSANRRAAYERAGGSAVSYAAKLRRDYGLTYEEYCHLVWKQDDRCAVCHRPEPVEGRRLAVDYDAAVHRVRGLLCSRCVVVVRAVEADPQLLEGLALYIGGAVR